MQFIPTRLRENFKLSVLGAAVGLFLIGLLGIYSADVNMDHIFFHRQLIWGGASILALTAGLLIPGRVYYGLAWVSYFVTLLLLALILIMGTVGMGAERWFSLGPLNFQPSEVGKLFLVFTLARFFSDQRKKGVTPRLVILGLILMGIPWALVVLQPDLGTSLCYAFLLFPMLVAAGVPFVHLFVLITPVLAVAFSFKVVILIIYLALLLIFLWRTEIPRVLVVGITVLNGAIGALVPVLWGMLREYQQKRILTFLNPDLDPLGAGYQIIQSKVAIGSGGFLGKGFLKGSQVQLDFLPAKHTDFIFSVIGEEFGFLGALIVLLLFGYLISMFIFSAFRHRNQFSGLVLTGIGSIFFFHVLVNIGMTVGFLPVTGLPLPFMSYGGSFLLTNFFMLGVGLNLIYHQREYA